MWIVIAGFWAGLTGTAGADDVTELRKQMEQQYEQMRQMQNKLIELEAAQKQQGVAVKKLEETEFALPENLAWVEKIQPYGDFRFRYEYRDSDWKSGSDDRFRIRARVGAKIQINEEFMFDFRVATAQFFDDEDEGRTVGGDFRSGNKTLGDYWVSDNAWIDRAYLIWTPNWAENWTFKFGKMGNPFYKVGKNQLIWDGDVNPEGVAFQYKKDKLFVNGMFGQVEENGSSADKRMLGIQGGLVHAFESGNKLTYGASYFDYSNVEGEEPIIDGLFAGNTTFDGETYAFDYNLLEGFAQYDTKLGDMPVSVYGNYVVNTASGVEEDTGWLIGTTLNKAKKPGSWQFGYTYRDLEADAVFGAFTDSDFARDGVTNSRGHTFNYTYALAKNTAISATYFHDENLNHDKSDNKRLQIDLKVKF
jgi:hypothetical protein